MQKQILENGFTLFILLLSSIYLAFAVKMPMGTISEPDSGFLPVILGVSGLLLSLGLLLTNLMKKHREKLEDFTKDGTFRLLGYIFVIFLFISTFKLLGFLIIFLSIFLLSKISGFKGWIKPIALAGGFTVFIYIFIGLLLSTPLPKGIFFS